MTRCSPANTLMLFQGIVQVQSEVSNIAELRVFVEEKSSTVDRLQRGQVQLLQSRVDCYHKTEVICIKKVTYNIVFDNWLLQLLGADFEDFVGSF